MPPFLISGRSIVIYPHLRLGLPSGLVATSLPIKTLYVPPLSPVRATCPTHQIFIDVFT